MEILKTKFWLDLDAASAIYAGSFSDGKHGADVYDLGEGKGFVLRFDSYISTYPDGDLNPSAWAIISAHRAQQAKPAMTREEKIEAAAKAHYGRDGERWEAVSEEGKDYWRLNIEAALLAIGAIDPAPVAPPVKEKTPGEVVAEAGVKIEPGSHGFQLVCIANGDRRIFISKASREIDAAERRNEIVVAASLLIDAALAAQAATLAEKHRKDLEGLRNRIECRLNGLGYRQSDHRISTIPLTI